jgi:acetyltransferase-like isoleucine patch superfamily enzyme
MRRLVEKLFRLVFGSHIWAVLRRFYYESQLPTFKCRGEKTYIFPPFFYGNPDRTEIGKNCRIGPGSDFGVVKESDSEGKIILGDNVWITARCQIYSCMEVNIKSNVLIAANVFICDYAHGYDKIDVPYKLQSYYPRGPVSIGEGSWIGQNAVILHGVTIGEQCIIGANSVVVNSIPPRSIAVGAPARVVKVWNDTLSKWEKPFIS